MCKALEEIVDRFGKDDDGFMRVNAKAGIIEADGTPRRFQKFLDRIVLKPQLLKLKKTTLAENNTRLPIAEKPSA